jgi:hypothetical protein
MIAVVDGLIAYGDARTKRGRKKAEDAIRDAIPAAAA